MLSEETRAIIKATIPVLEERGTEITTLFYKTMLSDHKELLNIFNKTNQAKGAQPTALATTVVAAAKHIDDLSPLIGHVKQIGHKHRALQIKPEHYPIVGENLLKAIKAVLGDAASPEIIDAWGQAYGEIAKIFIDVEQEMYDKAMWDGWKPFEVIGKQKVADDIFEFHVKPTLDSGIKLDGLNICAGQYITVNTHPTRQNNQFDALRHYSLCSINHNDGLKFAVKLEDSDNGVNPAGLVSEYLHKDVKVGDSIKISAPAGDFVLAKNYLTQAETPLIFLSSGAGVTPLLAMLEEQLCANPNRPIVWIQSSRSLETEAFKDKIQDLLSKFTTVNKYIVHTDINSRIDHKFLEKTNITNGEIYICGSLEFMEAMLEALKKLSVDESMIHYELFGPKMATIEVGLKK